MSSADNQPSIRYNATIPDVLFHYCGIDSFHEILKNQNIWLTNCRYFNDYNEVKHFERLTLEYLKENFEDTPFREAFLKEFRPSELEFYVLCFSEEPNSLSQWRGYADEGKGVNIGFNISSTKARSIFMDGFDLKYPFYYGPVIYDTEAAIKIVRGYMEPYIGIEEPNPKSVRFTAHLLSCWAIFYKEQHFKEEKEYRLVYIPNTKFWLLDVEEKTLIREVDLPDHLQNPLFASIRDAIVPLRSFRLLNDGEEPRNDYISSVCLGPRCKIQEVDLRKILEQYRFDNPLPEITESQITYRG